MTVQLAILDIFRPLLAAEQHSGPRTYLPLAASPTTIFAASVKQLKGQGVLSVLGF